MTRSHNHYNRASATQVTRTGSSQDFPAATLKDFIRWHIEKGFDYATTFAKACNPYIDLPNMETIFDQEWDKQGGA